MLKDHDIDFEFVNVKKQPMPAEKLRTAVDQLGLERVMNTKGTTYRKLGLKDKQLDEAELFGWLHKEQGMIKRPLIEKNDTYWVGFDEEGIIDFVK